MDIRIYVIASILYVGLLFTIAFFTDKKARNGSKFASNPYIYALSMAVFCTAWTFYGSVGKSARSGIGFLPVYFGPTIFAPLWLIVLRKMIIISKSQRITSIADFISSRYGKSTFLGVFVTIISIFGIVPYISLQLKAIADSFDLLANATTQNVLAMPNWTTEASPFFYTTAFYVALALALFTIIFGTRQLEPNERHEGLVTAIAFESIVKLIAFSAAGIFVTYGIYNGFGDLFSQAAANPATEKLLYLGKGTSSASEWFWLSIVSMCAVILLPRQFHIAIVENSNPNHVSKAMWLFPLYLLIINIFVLPIALGGMMQFGDLGVNADKYVLELPLFYHQNLLALFVFIGGFSAATSMVIVETTALSIMISNHLIMPPLLTSIAKRNNETTDFSRWVIASRRISILLILLLAYIYVQTIATNRELVSIGLISFVAVTQFAPSVFAGLFIKKATKAGAIAGLVVGFIVWGITLPIANLAEYKMISDRILTEGYFGQSWLRPYALFGLEGFDHISHGAFWSLFFNISAFIGVSMYSRQSLLEASQADFFVNISKYTEGVPEREILNREASMDDLMFLMNRFLGEERANSVVKTYENDNEVSISKDKNAQADFITYVETNLTGVLGASSAKILLSSVVKENPISLEEMLRVLDQTQEVMLTNRELEKQRQALQKTTEQLRTANDQLQELDRLKADFIANITHELRTPMTSIKSLSKILLDNKDMPEPKRDTFLGIIVNETERITRLVNQVLDIEKIESNAYQWRDETIDFTELAEKAYNGFLPIFTERKIGHDFYRSNKNLFVKGDSDKLTQVMINLISNALKFTNTEGGMISVSLTQHQDKAMLCIRDNGLGIALEKQATIFDRFTQINNETLGKPTGSGLGLFISKQIIDHHKGGIRIDSTLGEGATFIVELPIVQRPV